MTSCDDVRAELVAALRGEVSVAVARKVELHVARCAACAAERESLRQTMDLVRAHVHPEVSADARMQLSSALGDELRRARPRPLRRRVGTVLALTAALVAGGLAAWSVAPRPSPGPDRDAVALARLGRAAVTAGDLGPRTLEAVSRGLDWLAARQRPDGAWAPAAGSDRESTAAATALGLLAFAADGQSARRGPRAEALGRAQARLVDLLGAGFSMDAERKPVYAQALGVRALAATYALDRDAMSPDERRAARAAAESAGRDLRAWQRTDGGFGYVPRATRSDASCTLFAVAALRELRTADVLDATGALVRAGRYLESLRDFDGRIAYTSTGGGGTPELTAALLALDGEFGPSRHVPPRVLASIEEAAAGGGDALLSWTGAEALARHGRPIASPVRTLLASQREDGAWTAAADRRCAVGGDTVTTAFGVLALAQVYAR